MNFLHCFYGLGAVISPNIMALALQYARWNMGYRWTAYLQTVILAVCILSLPLWKNKSNAEETEQTAGAGILEALRVPGVVLTLVSFFAYCAGEATCFIWTSSYFAGTKAGMSDELVAAFGGLIFGGLMIGRLLSGFVSSKISDRNLIRIGIAIEFIGILLIVIPFYGVYSGCGRFSNHRDRHGTGLPRDPAYGAGKLLEIQQRSGHRPADGFRLHRRDAHADGIRSSPAGSRHLDHAGLSHGFCRSEHHAFGDRVPKNSEKRERTVIIQLSI